MASLTSITVKLSEEDRALLIDVLGALRSLSAKAAQVEETHPVENPFPATTPTPAPVEDPVPVKTEEPTPAPAPVEEPAPTPAPSYTMQDVRDRVMTLCRQGDGMKAKVKEALNRYAKTVQELDPSKYAEFMAALEVL